jgi:hypothetical protein
MVFKISFKLFIHLSCENFQIKSIVSNSLFKIILLSQSLFKKDFQKFIKSLPNWIQIPATIYFPFLCHHQGISIPRMALEIRNYLSINLPLFLFGPLHLPKCYSSCVKVTHCVKRSRCTYKHMLSLQPTNHLWFNYTPFFSFSFHRVQKKFHLLYLLVL